MSIDPGNWSWPHALLIALLAAHVAINAANQGQPVRNGLGDSGEPARYSTARALARAWLILFLCAAGGFFA